MVNKKYSVLIVEDEFPARKLIIGYLEEFSEIEIRDICRSGIDAFDKIKTNRYDLIFLDINLPDMSGIEILEKVNPEAYIIFTTAYDKFAIKAFELGAIDYLLKPISKERFNQSVDRFFLRNTNNMNTEKLLGHSFSFKENRNNFIVPFQEIIYFSSVAKHTVIHTKDRDFETPKLMKEIDNMLPEKFFIRIHKQYIINMKFILNLKIYSHGLYQVILSDEDDTTLPVGKTYLSKLKSVLVIKPS